MANKLANKLLAKALFKKVLMKNASPEDQNKETQEYINSGKTNYHEFLTNLNSYSASHPEEKHLMKDTVKMSKEQFPKEQRTEYSDAYAKSLGRGRNYPSNDKYYYGLVGDSCASAARFAENPEKELKHYFEALKFIALFSIGVPFLLGMMALSRIRLFKSLLFCGVRKIDDTYKKMEKKGIERKYAQELFDSYRKGDKKRASELEKECLAKAGIAVENDETKAEKISEKEAVAKKEINIGELNAKNNVKVSEKVESKVAEKQLVEEKQISK